MDTLTNQFSTYIAMIGVIALVGVLNKSPFPTSMLLVIVGMIISFIPSAPHIYVNSELVLNIFLPLLIYQASAYASWRDVKKYLPPIIYLSIGHVVFITVSVAVVIHWLIPEMSWPLCFVLGAVISPPDDVAIVSISQQIHFPTRIMTVLIGEGLLNDATALIIFRLALAAIITHEFSAAHAITSFFGIVIGETLYGLALGNLMGQIRMRFRDPIFHITLSFIIPSLAFLVPEHFGGSGVISTVVTGIVIGTKYLERYTPEVRLSTRVVWTSLAFILQNILFFLIGLDLRYIIERISTIPTATLFLYSISVILTVIIGRFIWVFGRANLARVFFPKYYKKNPVPPWQQLFIISWAGMRGGISLAAALAVPKLPDMTDGANPRDLLVFLVFSVIVATLLFQGMTLPWLLKVLGVSEHGEREKYKSHLDEIHARKVIAQEVLSWLLKYKKLCKENDEKLSDLVQMHILEYKTLKKHLQTLLEGHDEDGSIHDSDKDSGIDIALSMQIIKVQRMIVTRLWNANKINHDVKIRLTLQLDHHESQLTGYT